jgi:hypothetical protein
LIDGDGVTHKLGIANEKINKNLSMNILRDFAKPAHGKKIKEISSGSFL